MKQTTNQLKYKARRIVIRFAAITLLIAFGITSGVMLHVSAKNEVPPAALQDTITSGIAESSLKLFCVSPGDTLWSIAKEYAPEGISVKKYVQMIIDQNELASANIQVGQVLRLP